MAHRRLRRHLRTTPPRNLGEITVERINVVDADGTLRMSFPTKSGCTLT